MSSPALAEEQALGESAPGESRGPTAHVVLPVRAEVKLVREAAKRKQPIVLGSGVYGLYLREAFTRSTYTATDTAFSASVAANSLVYANYIELGQTLVRSDRSQLSAYAGGGSTGFDGKLLVDTAVGLRWPVADSHGPLVRLGARGWMLGNDYLYSSLIELPSVHAGYHLFKRGLLVEVAGRGGVALVGRFRARDAETRRLGESWVWGGHATVQLQKAILTGEWSRIQVQGGPVDVARLQVCGAAYWILLCSEVERHAERLDELPGGSGALERSAWMAGFSLGAGRNVEPQMAVVH
ncbi:MAG TPA: hypothetical protein VK524_32865 [Polyangiaceae bacterium]|nr:hypothetical protein [Polyangiaceae bacterium]